MSNLQLQTLLPLLLNEAPDAVTAKLDVLSASGITTANDILFPPANVSQSAKPLLTSLHPRILGFLAAEGSQAAALYKPNLPYSASTRNKAIDALFPNREMAFLPSEIVEIVGNHGSGRTYLMLQTVLRSLQKEKNAYALWLDTEGKFKAEDAASILLGIEDEVKNDPSANRQSESTGAENGHNGQSNYPSSSGHSLSALDRLIVSKAFDLQAAIRAIQEVRRDGFPAPATEAETKIELEGDGLGESLPPEAAIGREKQASGPPEQVAPPESSQKHAGEDHEGNQMDGPTGLDEAAPVAAANALRQAGLEPSRPPELAHQAEMHLRLIVIDSLTPLLSKLFSRESAEGHAKMMTFMRLLRSLVTSLPCIVLLSNGLTPATASSGNNLSVFASEGTQTVKPSLGPSFTYLCDITLALHNMQDVFPRETEPGRIVEIWRHRSGPAKRWAVARSDGVRWL